MKILPRTLLGRTSLSLGIILVVSSIAWTAAIGYFLLRPLRHIYERQLADTIMMTQALLTRDDSTAGPRNARPPFSQFSGLRLLAETDPTPKFLLPGQRTLPDGVQEGLRGRVGDEIELEQEEGSEIVWIRFRAGAHAYWLVVPLTPPAIFPYPTLIWVGGGFTLSIFGAYLIIYQLSRRLRHVTEAVLAVGRGQAAGPLEETGPQEIQELSAGFNQMARDLQQHESERRLMLAGISHDIRTPLTRLRIAAELGANKSDPALTSGMINDIGDMDAILRQFLDYARDGSEETPEKSDLDEIVRDVCERYARAGHAIAVSVGDVPPFTFRPLAIRRVVTNLVENAMRYGRTSIEVRTWTREGGVTLEVADRGPGVAAERLAEIGRPFARAESSRSELGAGLGLAIVSRIAAAHGGSLTLANREGGGFVALVALPLKRSAACNTHT